LQYCKIGGLTKNTKRVYTKRNLWGLVNGLTYAAHTQFADNQEAMTEMELKAGAWLMSPPKVIQMATVSTMSAGHSLLDN